MVDCRQFREDYSDFRDGLLSEARREAFAAHLSACPTCERYDRVICKGAAVLRELPSVQPSDDFLPRLQHRLYHLEEDLEVEGSAASGAPVALVLAIAGAIAAIAWLPLARPRSPVVHLPPVAAHAPYHAPVVPVLFRTGPMLVPAGRPPMAPAAEPLRLRLPEGDRYTLLPTQLGNPR